MEWREQSSVSCEDAYLEAQRWIEAVTKKKFGSKDFRSALENGILLCDLINNIKPGIIKRVNRLPTPIAGLDNLNVFLKACGKLGLKEAQLFHPGDLQDLSTRVTVKHQETNRRLKNVLITIYWLGRRAQCDHFYDGPYLNFKAFEGLLGTALYKALHETSSHKLSNIRDSGFGDSWCSVREELHHLRGGGGDGHKRDDSLDSLDSLGLQPHSISSDTTLKGSSEGCFSDTEADSGFRMTDNKDNVTYRRSVSITPKSTAPFNQFLPSKDKPSGYVPAPLRRKRAERNEDSRRSLANYTYTEDEGTLTSCGETQPPKGASAKVEHHPLVCTDSLFREIYDDSEDEDDEVGYADPIQDDLYARKMGIKSKPSGNESHDKFLPKLWAPEEDVHIQKIKLGSQRRPWYTKIQGFRNKKLVCPDDDSDSDSSPRLSPAPSPSGTSPIPLNTHEASAHTTLVVGTRSKSTSDIQVNPNIIWQARSEQLQKYREQLKESEDKWQDDLSKWKTRRRSVNSDIVQKKEEREKIEQITHSSNRRSKTFKEMQEERENKGHLSSLSYLEEDVFERPAISLRSQTLPTRSYSIDSHYYSSETFAPSLKEAKPPTGSPATARLAPRAVDTVDSPAGSGQTSTTAVTPSSHSSLHSSSQSPAEASSSPSSLVSGHISSAKPEVISTSVSSSSSVKKVFDPLQPSLRTKVEVEVSSSGSLYKHQPQLSSMEPNSSSISRISSSLPRSYQKSDSARLSSVLTPKPFGTKPSLVTSLPRAFMVDNSQRVNGDVAVPKKSAVPSRYQQFMTLEDEADSSSAHSSEEEEEEEMNETTVKSTSVSSVPPPVKSEAAVTPAPIKESVKANYCEMRISLNQKPNSSKDFGFQAVWDSTGAHVTSIQPGSHAEMYQLQAGDEVLTVNRHQVAEMNYIDWKTCMQEALQEGSLVMDIRRHGKNSSSDAATVNSSLDLTSRISMETLTAKGSPKHPVIDVASNGVNGVVREELLNMGNKDSESITLKNLKRRSEFFETGGSESAMPDIPVPLITPSVSRWSWDPEEERRRQEKWQKEQELLLQEKYKRDQEKLQAEWLKAQQDIRKSTDQGEPERLEVDSHNIGPRSPLSPLKPPASFPWEAKQEHQRQVEENRRREEERELQRLHEEKERKERQEEEERKRKERQVEEERKRKERQVEEERMWKERQEEEDRKRKEQEDRQQKEEEERKKLEEEELRWQKRREEEREEARRRQDAAEQLRRERERAFEQQQRQQQWVGSSYGFSNIQPPLSFTDRMKSKSTPQLEQENNAPWKGVNLQPGGGRAHWLLETQLRCARDKEAQRQRAVAELEMERRNILDAMRHRQPKMVNSSGASEKRGQQPVSQAEVNRQHILNEMKKKTPLLTDNSWIRQRSSSAVNSMREDNLPNMRRGESLDNLDARSSWRSSWTPRSNAYIPNYTRPQSAFYGSTSFYGGGSGVHRPSTLPSSYAPDSLRSGAGTPSSLLSPQSHSPSSLSPTCSPEPTSNAGTSQQRNSAPTVSLTSEDQRPGLKSEYEINSCTVTSATCDSKLASQPPCDMSVLQQIDEETTCDNNP